MTSPPLPSPAGCEAADHSSNVPIPAEKLYEDFTVPEVVFLDSTLAAISLLSEMLTYKSIGLDGSMAGAPAYLASPDRVNRLGVLGFDTTCCLFSLIGNHRAHVQEVK